MPTIPVAYATTRFVCFRAPPDQKGRCPRPRRRKAREAGRAAFGLLTSPLDQRLYATNHVNGPCALKGCGPHQPIDMAFRLKKRKDIYSSKIFVQGV